MTLTLTVHRGTQQIGGSCIELASSDGERLILDAGRPLDAPREATGLLPETLDIGRPAHVVFSHPHMDHWGLIQELPQDWPLWTGEKSALLMKLTMAIFGDDISQEINSWQNRSGILKIGGFEITPFLTDHSALDAYMLLIQKDGVRVLYTGDFRTHGRKGRLVEALIAAPPPEIDALLMEGTNLRSDKPVVTERDLEDDFVSLADEVDGHIFVDWSAQNFDRTVTLFRAARRTGRKLIIDLYTAEALNIAAQGTALPRPDAKDFPELEVVITPKMKFLMNRMGRGDLIQSLVNIGRATSRWSVNREPAIIMARKSLVADYEQKGSLPITARDCFVHSSWSGYLDESDRASGWVIAGERGARRELIHTSGHAASSELSRFACAMNPRTLVPVHGVEWDAPGIELPPITRLVDGQSLTIDIHARQLS